MADLVALSTLITRIREDGEIDDDYWADSVVTAKINDAVKEMWDAILAVPGGKDFLLKLSNDLTVAAVTNLCLQSRDLTTTWAKEDSGDVVAKNVATGPDYTATASSIAGDSTNGTHGVTQAITLTAETYVFSCYVKAGDKNFIQLVNSTVSNCDCYFNLSTGAVGTAGAGCYGGIEAVENGWYRVWIVFTGTAAAHTFILRPANADSDNDFAGDGSTRNSFFWGAQVQTGDRPTRHVPTTTAAAADNGMWVRLPEDCGVDVEMVEVKDGDSDYRPIRPFNLHDRGDNTIVNVSEKLGTKYKVLGEWLLLTPTPNWTGSVRVWYVRKPVPLSGTSDAHNFWFGWDRYVRHKVCQWHARARGESKEANDFRDDAMLVLQGITKRAMRRTATATRIRDGYAERRRNQYPWSTD